MVRAANYLFAALLGIWGEPAFSLSLGDIDVLSKLNQPMSAIIPIQDTTSDELENLRVKLAAQEDFTRLGIQRSDLVSSLSFKIRTDGQPRVVVTSPSSVREPVVDFVVEASWIDGRLLREYTVLLDPPSPPAGDMVADTEVAAEASSPVARPRPQAATPASEPTPPRSVRPSGGYYGPVKPQETLWSIAEKLRPDPATITMDQMLLALYQQNPGAFKGGISGLLKGSRLRVPTLEQIRANDAASAKAEVERLKHGGGRSTPMRKPAPKKAAAEPPAQPSVREPVPVPQPAATPAPATTEAAPAQPHTAPAETAPATQTETQPGTQPEAQPTPSEKPPEAAAEQNTASGPGATTGGATSGGEAPSGAGAPSAAEPPQPTPPPAEKPKTPAPQPESSGPGLINLLALGLDLVALVGLLVWLMIRRNRSNNEPAPKRRPEASAKPDDGEDAEDESSEDSTPILAAAAAGEAAAETDSQTADDGAAEPAADEAPAAAAAVEAPSLADDADFSYEPADDGETAEPPASGSGMNLDANDPLAEADFHLAYGLYDEAIALLKQAIVKEPARDALKIKLAETYFAAGRPVEFQDCAAELQGRISDSEWNKIAIMGRQLCPDASMFLAPVPADAMSTPSVDMALDDEPLPRGRSSGDPFAPPANAPSVNLGDIPAFEPLPELPAVPPAAEPAREAPPFETVEPVPAQPAEPMFDLSHFDLALDQPETPNPPFQPPGATRPLEFNLDELDLGQPQKPEPPEPTLPPAPPPGDSALPEPRTEPRAEPTPELPSEAPFDEAGFGDEAGTKLDLARAYADMGDNDAARSLLNEVLESGTDVQKQEADTLLRRLTG